MTKESSNWRAHLEKYERRATSLFDAEFLGRWGAEPWNPGEDDRTAAGLFHIELVSRIATQSLGYSDGDEATALKSIYDLFERARTICANHIRAAHFEPMVWHVLNRHVRPFTAKWHRRSTLPTFSALDATDEFRAELAKLQPILALFDELLLELRDGRRPPTRTAAAESRSQPKDALTNEMERHVYAAIEGAWAQELNGTERAAIRARREHYKDIYVDPAAYDQPTRLPDAVGLALSGGGIRSATFSLGVLISLARRNLLPQVDYLSTVSGGGYLGAFLSTYLQGPKRENAPKKPGKWDRLIKPFRNAFTGTKEFVRKIFGKVKTPPAAAAAIPGPTSIGLRKTDLPFCETGRKAVAIGHIRQNSRYLLSGSAWSRLQIAFAQIFGLIVNIMVVAIFVAAFALAEVVLRRSFDLPWSPRATLVALAAMLLGVAFLLLLAMRAGPRASAVADSVFAGAALVPIGAALWIGLGSAHQAVGTYSLGWGTIALLLAAPALIVGLAILAGRLIGRFRLLFRLVAALSVPLFLFEIYFAFYALFDTFHGSEGWRAAGSIIFLMFVLAWALDVNFTGLHRHYRKKLAGVFTVQQAGDKLEEVALKLSDLPGTAAPYPLINAALNVPGSTSPAMQGRLTDFFLFSPGYCGSPILGFHEIAAWEAKNEALDVATAMAVSGAAASPQMGLSSPGRLAFWLALANVRLGYWLERPNVESRSVRARLSAIFGRPGLFCLLREMSGRMNESSRHVNVSDGGHIENLGIYELLRRRCKYIIAVDGEEDRGMTFAGLTTLQRMAAIDLGVTIDIDLDDLRLNDNGLSRSHFRFGRIRYGKREGGDDGANDVGYLLYLKLSLTGNEGEFLRRYKLDEPDFPHHSTLEQVFTEAQFEAYRSLGEHVGDKLFLEAIVGDLEQDDVRVDKWFAAIGRSFLEPDPSARASRSPGNGG